MNKQVYIAGPLFTKGDRWFLEKVDKILSERNLSTYLPHRDGGLCPSDGRDTSAFFESDVKHLDSCQFIVAILHGTDIDSGTAWEMGYGFAKGKVVISIAEDIRIANEITNINLMLSNSSKVCFDIEQFTRELDNFLSTFKDTW